MSTVLQCTFKPGVKTKWVQNIIYFFSWSNKTRQFLLAEIICIHLFLALQHFCCSPVELIHKIGSQQGDNIICSCDAIKPLRRTDYINIIHLTAHGTWTNIRPSALPGHCLEPTATAQDFSRYAFHDRKLTALSLQTHKCIILYAPSRGRKKWQIFLQISEYSKAEVAKIPGLVKAKKSLLCKCHKSIKFITLALHYSTIPMKWFSTLRKHCRKSQGP